ncbi:hypothetical protein [Microbacterium elymi]|uniref:Uncharacterized protein n=1 Tax=Microbacterium elymi TaxID=2909587 RepID=A0ABY5NJK0_9MICO|nr:hypothetical protein [Microbacterium elymi]UUT35296.1 hypothetical protein L2X98_34575 [Microbacterium elymi]
MNLLVTPVLVVLIGLFVRSRLIATLLYLVIEAILFTFQTLAVLLGWMAGEGGFGGATEQGAFGPAPTGFPLKFDEGEFWAYGLVNLGIMTIGVAIVVLIVTLRNRSRAKKNAVTVN